LAQWLQRWRSSQGALIGGDDDEEEEEDGGEGLASIGDSKGDWRQDDEVVVMVEQAKDLNAVRLDLPAGDTARRFVLEGRDRIRLVEVVTGLRADKVVVAVDAGAEAEERYGVGKAMTVVVALGAAAADAAS